jgi:hypothetical protein
MCLREGEDEDMLHFVHLSKLSETVLTHQLIEKAKESNTMLVQQ